MWDYVGLLLFLAIAIFIIWLSSPAADETPWVFCLHVLIGVLLPPLWPVMVYVGIKERRERRARDREYQALAQAQRERRRQEADYTFWLACYRRATTSYERAAAADMLEYLRSTSQTHPQ